MTGKIKEVIFYSRNPRQEGVFYYPRTELNDAQKALSKLCDEAFARQESLYLKMDESPAEEIERYVPAVSRQIRDLDHLDRRCAELGLDRTGELICRRRELELILQVLKL